MRSGFVEFAALNSAVVPNLMVTLPGFRFSHGQEPVEYPEISLALSCYRARLACTEEDRKGIYRLRFIVFNLELDEGIESAYQTGEDRDEFDTYCDHLLVEDVRTGQAVGTYRFQSGSAASEKLGYYSAREFDFLPYEPLRDSLLELGRACIHRDHRSMEVLTLLWRGIAAYALYRNLRYLIGCSSLTTQDIGLGAAMYRRLEGFLVEPQYRTYPSIEHEFPLVEDTSACAPPPKLLRAYLSIGAKICGPPAIDRQFGTIDFLTLLDLRSLSSVVRARFLI